ncbi:MAG TPA: cation:proton antiporter [Isosphaeraceae bacterium]|nr:cation:proton antiporter [Isosphaeraceae bacterium]
MSAVLLFSLTLLVAVLFSELAERSVLSAAVLFLGVGILSGEEMLGILPLKPDDLAVSTFAELALFSVLFVDGMRLSLRDLTRAWRLPGRALILGLPLTLLVTAMLAHLLVGFSWAESFLLGAVLSPTDPVFASAIVGRDEVPSRLRLLLNVESGINDGLALPLVVTLLAVVSSDSVSPVFLIGQVALGLAIGIAIPLAAIFVQRIRVLRAHSRYQPLFGFAIGLVVLSMAKLLHGNEFLAAFSAGITVSSSDGAAKRAFLEFGELIAELLKLAALLVFGSLLQPSTLLGISWQGYLFSFLVLVVARPLAIALALWRSPLGNRERVTAAWFGPKGFASVVFSLWVYEAGSRSGFGWENAERLAALAGLCIAVSIVAHSSTDIVVVRWFRSTEDEENQRKAHSREIEQTAANRL